MFSAMAYQAHGGVHLMIGGSCGVGSPTCDTWTDVLSDIVTHEHMNMIKSQASFVLRNVWRYDLCTMPSHAECAHATESECLMSCTGCENEELTAGEVKRLAQWWPADVVQDISAKQLEKVVRTIFCDSKTIIGEHVEASSPIDHSFWAMHGTLERLMQYKQLVDPFTDYTWDASVYRTDWTSECKWGLTFGTDCQGHAATDKAAGMMRVLDAESGLFVEKHMSNQHIVEMSLPEKTLSLPYVYDTFDYSHCEADGIIFKKVPKTAKTA